MAKNSAEPTITRQPFNRIPNGAAFFIPTVAGGSTGTGPFIKTSGSTYAAANTIPTPGVNGNQGTTMSPTNAMIIRMVGWMTRSATLP
jgi:hypothetical protein